MHGLGEIQVFKSKGKLWVYIQRFVLDGEVEKPQVNCKEQGKSRIYF